MKQIQASEAKAKLAELLDDVEGGEIVVITRHGKPIARLVPEDKARRDEARRAIEEIKAAQKNAPRATIKEIIAWKNEGRR